MPCTITGSEAGDMALHIDELRKSAQKTNAMLCDVLQKWEDAGRPFELSEEQITWWKLHTEIDGQRIKLERKKK